MSDSTLSMAADASSPATRSSPEADAAHHMAVKAAEGSKVPQNWDAALDHLQRAAELGLPLAQAELAAAAGRWKLAHDILSGKRIAKSGRSRSPADAGSKLARSRWSRLRDAIDLSQWLITPAAVTFSKEPRMTVVKDLAPPEFCDWLIARARPRLTRAVVFDEVSNELRTVQERSNSDSVFNQPDRDLFMAIVRARIAAVSELPVRAMEPPEILHYSVGQEYRRHFDTPADPNAPGFHVRALTVLLSLNDDYEGGQTEFPVVGGRWRGRKGTALFFWNVGPDGARDSRLLHAGLPVKRGEKWLLSQFVGLAKQP
jgi:hypothetical protein